MSNMHQVKPVGRLFASMAVLASFVPVFLTPSTPYLNVAGTPQASLSLTAVNIHWSLAVGPILLALSVLGGRRLGRVSLPKPALFLVAWLFIVTATAVMIGSDDGWTPLLSTLQLVLPLCFYVIGAAIANGSLVNFTLRLALRVITAYSALLLAFNIAAVLGGAPHQIAVNYPQYLTYHPGLMAFGGGLAWALFRQMRWTVMLFTSVSAMMLPAVWSRLGLVTILVGLVAAAWVLPATKAGFSARSRNGSLLLAVVLGGLVMGVALQGEVGQRLESKSSALESGRYALMTEAGGIILDSPIVGTASRAIADRGALGGYGGQEGRIFPAHSQFLDMGIRGGIPAMVLYVLLIAILLRRAKRLSRERDVYACVGVSVTCVVLIASFSDLYMSQAITAAPAWLIIALSWRAYEGGTESPTADRNQSIRRCIVPRV